ncbi:smoothelin-like protein 1 isoform X2 [Latimeria chalumnae]|uniref:smoothelin-like protein 1 isoform X2 n=1 Tax=Latimeria chalumnae TaxID=7897 RepID=UPI00313AFB8D
MEKPQEEAGCQEEASHPAQENTSLPVKEEESQHTSLPAQEEAESQESATLSTQEEEETQHSSLPTQEEAECQEGTILPTQEAAARLQEEEECQEEARSQDEVPFPAQETSEAPSHGNAQCEEAVETAVKAVPEGDVAGGQTDMAGLKGEGKSPEEEGEEEEAAGGAESNQEAKESRSRLGSDSGEISETGVEFSAPFPSTTEDTQTGDTATETAPSPASPDSTSTRKSVPRGACPRPAPAGGMERRTPEKKRELSRSQTMPRSFGAQSRKAIIAKFEKDSGGDPNGSTSKLKVLRVTSSGASKTGSVKQMLLEWCQAKTRGYEHVDIQNFSSSWSDGLAFCALIHHFFPDSFDFSQLSPKNRKHNFELAFNTAEEKASCDPTP